MMVTVEMRVVLFVVRVMFCGVIIVELRTIGGVVEMRVVLFVVRVSFWGLIIVELRTMGPVVV